MKQTKWQNIEGRVNLAGVQYHQYNCVVGNPVGKVVKLVGEIGNRYDEMAVRVEYAGVKLGYLPRGSIHQSEAWKAHANGYKLVGVITYFSKKCPTWCAITVQLMRTEKKQKKVIIPTEIDFTK